jgi:hypothetical protein
MEQRTGDGPAARHETPWPWKTVAERRAVGWDAILGALLVLSVPLVVVSREVMRNWERIGQSSTSLWVLPLVLACYAALPAAFLCVGRGLMTGRAGLVRLGGALFVGACAMA